MSAFFLGAAAGAVQEEDLTWFSAWATPKFPDTCLLHTYTIRSWEADGFGGRSTRTHLLLFSPDILVCPDRNTSVASSAPGQKEDTGKLRASRAGRRHTRSEGTAAGRDQQRSANVEHKMSLLPHQIHCSFPLCPRLLIWATTDLKTLHKWFLLFGLLPF